MDSDCLTIFSDAEYRRKSNIKVPIDNEVSLLKLSNDISYITNVKIAYIAYAPLISSVSQ